MTEAQKTCEMQATEKKLAGAAGEVVALRRRAGRLDAADDGGAMRIAAATGRTGGELTHGCAHRN